MDSSNLFEGQGLDSLYVEAKEAALRFLAYRARSEAEVRRRLSRKYPIDTVDKVIDALQRQSLVDDGAFALMWRNNREQHRPRAKRLVQQELAQRGVAPEVIQNSLDGFDDEANAYQAGLRLAQRQSIRNSAEDNFRRRVSSHLQRRGFSFSIVRVTVERLWRELGPDSLNGHDNTNNDE